MSIDRFLDRQYNSATYNCAHFVCEVWETVSGEPMGDRLKSFLLPSKLRYVERNLFKHFERLAQPVDGCIALMRRRHASSHVGIYRNKRILHIDQGGVRMDPLAVALMTFDRVDYFK